MSYYALEIDCGIRGVGVLSLPRKRLWGKGSKVSYHSLEKRLWSKGSGVLYYSIEKDCGIRGVGCLITP